MAILKPLAAIFDVDGTLCDVSGIRHYVKNPRHRDFTSFHAASIFAPAHQQVVELAQSLHENGVTIFVVTARKERWRYMTSTWLQKYGVPFLYLYMREDNDDRKDVEVKRDILNRIIIRYRPILAVDDNPAVIELWDSHEIPTIIVPGWEVE